jgi:Family of unknown function (DUF6065)
MTKKITVYQPGPVAANIEQLGATREWMDNSWEKHAYQCFPLTLTNGLGWGISFPKDISFIWDGITDTTPDHVKILEGEEFVYTGRGNATISFKTSLIFRTDEDTTMLIMPVPNLFNPSAQCFTALISTSFFKPELPIAWSITEPNVVITIPAGTPVATVVPISLNAIQNYELELTREHLGQEYFDEMKAYGDAAQEKNGVGIWSKMYRNAVNSRGEKAGKHELKTLRLKTTKKD